jgi:hypothetical protein
MAASLSLKIRIISVGVKECVLYRNVVVVQDVGETVESSSYGICSLVWMFILASPSLTLPSNFFCGRVDHATYLVDVLRKEPKMLVGLQVMRLTMGDIITEIAGKKKSYVLLWASQPKDYGRGLIVIDGCTRNTSASASASTTGR